MKIKTSFKQHLLLRFVVIPLLLAPGILLALQLGAGKAETAIAAGILVLAWLITSYRFGLRISENWRRLAANLVLLENGKEPLVHQNPDSMEASLQTTMANISVRIRKQENELQLSKIQRLRSVIDGQDQERNRLARELHDGLGQSLIAIKLQLENAETQHYSMMRAGIDSAKSMIDLTIEEVRRVCNALLPAALNEFGIVSTLRARFDEMATLAGFKVCFESEGSLDRLDKKSMIYLYRIAQEALNNIAKHARATEVAVKLQRIDNIVALMVKDNGKGFIFDPVNFANRNGLQNMQERTLLLQGKFELDSQPGKGTTIKVTIPYNIGDGKNQTYSG